jgi:hypothetical protein
MAVERGSRATTGAKVENFQRFAFVVLCGIEHGDLDDLMEMEFTVAFDGWRKSRQDHATGWRLPYGKEVSFRCLGASKTG